MVALAQIDGLENEDVHRVLDLAARIAGRQLDVGDDRVARVVRVELAVGLAAELLIRAHAPVGPEHLAVEHGRLRLRGVDDDPRNVCRGRSGGQGQDDQNEQQALRGGSSDPRILRRSWRPVKGAYRETDFAYGMFALAGRAKQPLSASFWPRNGVSRRLVQNRISSIARSAARPFLLGTQ